MSEPGTRPITRQRSPWKLQGEAPGMPWAAWWRRLCGDGVLDAFVADEPGIGWHMSISHRGPKNRAVRYPRWDEIAHARYELLPHDVDFVMHLPPPDEYVAVHDTTFHLHEHHGAA
jgi:hypothetical protein